METGAGSLGRPRARGPHGLCETCVHARVVPTPRSEFVLCGRSADDPRYAKYPRLPVHACAGYEAARNDPAPSGG
jgi:hypothetical protein